MGLAPLPAAADGGRAARRQEFTSALRGGFTCAGVLQLLPFPLLSLSLREEASHSHPPSRARDRKQPPAVFSTLTGLSLVIKGLLVNAHPSLKETRQRLAVRGR